MRKFVGAAIAASLLAGCAADQPKPLFIRADGKPVTGNPALETQFELDRAVCEGESNKANLSGVTLAGGGFAGAIAQAQRHSSALEVGRGCMAARGYLLSNDRDADEKLAQLRRTSR